MTKLKWVVIDDFPGYAVCEDGRIMNTHTDLCKQVSLNQQGIAMVNFSVNGRQNVRALAPIVARAFVDQSEVPRHFDTPIHLDGDRLNCRADNLVWRPRWFARKYHSQFDQQARATNYGFRTPVILLDTEEIFSTSWEAATKYGLLDKEIFLAVVNATYVFPHNFRFEEWDERY